MAKYFKPRGFSKVPQRSSSLFLYMPSRLISFQHIGDILMRGIGSRAVFDTLPFHMMTRQVRQKVVHKTMAQHLLN